MKHLGKVTRVREMALHTPGAADAKTDFMNAIWRAWSDYVYEKKNEMAL